MSSKYNAIKSIIKAGLSKKNKADTEEVKKARQLFQEMIELPSADWESIDTTPMVYRKMDSVAYEAMKKFSAERFHEGKDRSPRKEKKKTKKAPLKNTEFVREQIELVEEVMNNA